jgi:hypothetical protein
VASITFKARTIGADRVARRFFEASVRLPSDLLGAEKELGQRAEIAFAAHAPFKTGRLIRGIRAETGGGGVIVEAHARNPADGYDYVGVSRWGHGIIRPKHRSTAPAHVLATGKKRSSGHKAALRFVIGGRVVYASYVRAWKPASDWRDDALPEIEAEAQAVATRLGHTIESRF